ncbi:hypothetical protein TNCV_4412571 [Trichonephila clavipes]|nr:hypothetical protein TNCV_4412571 [Trichonephila clavipes]
MLNGFYSGNRKNRRGSNSTKGQEGKWETVTLSDRRSVEDSSSELPGLFLCVWLAFVQRKERSAVSGREGGI